MAARSKSVRLPLRLPAGLLERTPLPHGPLILSRIRPPVPLNLLAAHARALGGVALAMPAVRRPPFSLPLLRQCADRSASCGRGATLADSCESIALLIDFNGSDHYRRSSAWRLSGTRICNRSLSRPCPQASTRKRRLRACQCAARPGGSFRFHGHWPCLLASPGI